MRRSIGMAMALAIAGAGALGGAPIEVPARRGPPPKPIGPKYKPEKPRKNRALRRIKGR